jgi:hypothetical protein
MALHAVVCSRHAVVCSSDHQVDLPPAADDGDQLVEQGNEALRITPPAVLDQRTAESACVLLSCSRRCVLAGQRHDQHVVPSVRVQRVQVLVELRGQRGPATPVTVIARHTQDGGTLPDSSCRAAEKSLIDKHLPATSDTVMRVAEYYFVQHQALTVAFVFDVFR